MSQHSPSHSLSLSFSFSLILSLFFSFPFSHTHTQNPYCPGEAPQLVWNAVPSIHRSTDVTPIPAESSFQCCFWMNWSVFSSLVLLFLLLVSHSSSHFSCFHFCLSQSIPVLWNPISIQHLLPIVVLNQLRKLIVLSNFSLSQPMK